MSYDSQNIFARILRGDVPCKKIYEDTVALAFHDLHPKASIHVLVIPKGDYCSFDDFMAKATAEEIAGFFKAVYQVAHQLGIALTGYRLIANHGSDSRQEVPHFHVHILGGSDVGPMTTSLHTSKQN